MGWVQPQNRRQGNTVTSDTVSEKERRERGREERQGGSDRTVMTEGTGADWTRDLLAGKLVNTMYEVTVSSVDAVGLLRVVAAPRVTHARRRGGGGSGHYMEDRQTERQHNTGNTITSLLKITNYQVLWQLQYKISSHTLPQTFKTCKVIVGVTNLWTLWADISHYPDVTTAL